MLERRDTSSIFAESFACSVGRQHHHTGRSSGVCITFCEAEGRQAGILLYSNCTKANMGRRLNCLDLQLGSHNFRAVSNFVQGQLADLLILAHSNDSFGSLRGRMPSCWQL